MADRPPRRTQRPQKRRATSFPLIPFSIGIVVLGFVLGAGLSMLGRKGTTPVASVAKIAPRPTLAAATLAPLATPRPLRSEASQERVASSVTATATAPIERARPSARVKPSAHATTKASVHPSAEPSAIDRLRPTARPSPANTTASARPSAIATTAARSAPAVMLVSPVTPAALRTHAVAAAKTAPPAAVPVPAVTTVAALAPAPGSATIDADSDFGRLSASVVRQYLRALARGDTASAYGAFGASPGSAGISFSERPVLDSTAQIGVIQAHGSSDAQTVSVTIATSAGPYYATYSVRRSATGAAVIVSHSINKG